MLVTKLMLKQALFDMHRDRHSGVTNNVQIPVLHNTLDSLAGLVFLGVPHLGSRVNKKKRVRIIEAIATIPMSKPKALTDALKSESEELSSLCENFEKTPMFTQSQIVVYSYYETLGGKEGCVVSDRSCFLIRWSNLSRLSPGIRRQCTYPARRYSLPARRIKGLPNSMPPRTQNTRQ
jgi:hypothetical protein